MRLSVTRPLLWNWWEEPLWETVHLACSAGKNQPLLLLSLVMPGKGPHQYL